MEKDNKLIAEFMELPTEVFNCGNLNYYFKEFNSGTWYEEHELSYNISWDWLMPVVEKCLEKHNNLIDGRDVIDTSYPSIAQALEVVSLKETYKAVVEFVKMYNTKKKGE